MPGKITQCRLTVGLLLAALIFIVAAGARAADDQTPPPRPLLPIPTQRQLRWQTDELAMFVHFTVNTFTDREWGDGTEDPGVFHPTDFSTDQWARVAKEVGFEAIVLTAKHHDGFCLWPSKYTDHSVESTEWRNGAADVVGSLAESCREFGVGLGIYLSPWDRHEPVYGQQVGYNEYYMAQLRELLTNYGPVEEMWFDGAKGSDAPDMEYNFDAYWSMVRQLQPTAVIFSDAGPDVRWVGNEHGSAGEVCWGMMNRSEVEVGHADRGYLNTGDPNGPDWVPAETDVSIRPGWFWHKDEDPKSVEHLVDIYFQSVGRNSKLLLNVPPSPKGRLPEEDVKRLREWRKALDAIFDEDLATGGKATASNVRGGEEVFAPEQALNEDLETYWATDNDKSSGWIEVDLGEAATFNVVRMQEPIHMGQRVKSYRLEVRKDGTWQKLAEGGTIGYKRLQRVPKTTARRVRLVIEEAREDVCPLISGFGLYLDPNRD